jgi:lipopolysaccharide transport system ATP-binding protein
LLLDEVLAVGDAEFQKKCLGKMKDVAKQGRTVLFVSHNMGSILDLCPRSILLESGMVIQDGISSEILHSYLPNDFIENQFQLSGAIRSGDSRARITYFKINPPRPRTGSPIQFIVMVESSENELKPLTCDLSVSIRTDNDLPLLQIHSRDMAKSFTVEPGIQEKIIVSLPLLPLLPGKYKVNLWLGRPNATFDWIKESFILNVFSGSFVKENSVISENYPVVVPGNWSNERSS